MGFIKYEFTQWGMKFFSIVIAAKKTYMWAQS